MVSRPYDRGKIDFRALRKQFSGHFHTVLMSRTPDDMVRAVRALVWVVRTRVVSRALVGAME